MKRIRSKGWFITLPQCPLDKDEVLNAWQEKFKIEEYCVARERHKDGEFHIHAFLKMKTKIEFKATMFDVAIYHGNYQVAKSWRAVAEYCQKDGDFISNINM